MSIDEVLARLAGVKRNGAGYQARCPAHEDTNPSLSVTEGLDGRVLVKCHAGCPTGQVVTALGLELRDLFADDDILPREILATYPYTDEQGAVLYEVVRFHPKDFRQRRPDGYGGWIWNLNGTRRVPYRLPELRQAVAAGKCVFVVEGEKDVTAVEQAGFAATCNPGGAGKWRQEYAEYFHDADVVIVADNDAPGLSHARQVRDALQTVARRVVVVGPVEGKDVSDHLAAGHTVKELVPLTESVPPQHTGGKGRLIFTRLGDLLAEPDEAIAWLVDGILPTGGLSVLAGKPKTGKSTLVRCLALAVARGEPWLGRRTHRGSVLYLGLEEKRAEVRRHFAAMGAALGARDPVFVHLAPSPADALLQLREAVETHAPVLIIVDPLFRFVRVPDSNEYAVMTAALEPLMTLARETGAHLLTSHHNVKGDRAGGDAILGSTAIFGSVDAALLLKRSENYRTLTSIQRYGEDLEETTLNMDTTTRWVSVGPSREQADEEVAAKEILAYLKQAGEWVETAGICEAVEARRAVVLKALKELVEIKQLEREGKGGRGGPFRFRFPVPTPNGEPQNRNDTDSLNADTPMGNPVPVNSEVFEVAGTESVASATASEPRPCPRCRAPMRHYGARPDAGWVCATCYPRATAAMEGA